MQRTPSTPLLDVARLDARGGRAAALSRSMVRACQNSPRSPPPRATLGSPTATCSCATGISALLESTAAANAVAYTARGSVTMTTRPAGTEALEIEVCYTGPGIAADRLRIWIFDQFVYISTMPIRPATALAWDRPLSDLCSCYGTWCRQHVYCAAAVRAGRCHPARPPPAEPMPDLAGLRWRWMIYLLGEPRRPRPMLLTGARSRCRCSVPPRRS